MYNPDNDIHSPVPGCLLVITFSLVFWSAVAILIIVVVR